MKYYAGIGSRETPKHILETMTLIAKKLSKLDYVCNSGGAKGADEAFEVGASRKQIFLPWDGFNKKYANNKDYLLPPINEKTQYYVNKFHPAPNRLSDAGVKFMSRNTYQVLGNDLNTPVDFVLCWTKDGKDSGGTGQAIRIANSMGIPVFNFKNGFDNFSTYMTQTILFDL